MLLVDDHPLIRGGLRHAFERDRDFEVVGEADNIAEAMRQAGMMHPNVVIMDVSFADKASNGLEATRVLRQSFPDMGVVVLTVSDKDSCLMGAMDARASAFVSKSAPVDEVVSAARHAATAPSVFAASGLVAVVDRMRAPSGPQLTPREKQVLALLAEGRKVDDIAKALFVSDSTTKTHISKLYEKLGVKTRTQALMRAMALGLLEPPDEG